MPTANIVESLANELYAMIMFMHELNLRPQYIADRLVLTFCLATFDLHAFPQLEEVQISGMRHL